MLKAIIAAALALTAGAALAQQQQPSPEAVQAMTQARAAVRDLKGGVTEEIEERYIRSLGLAADFQRQVKERDARIAELEKLCGDACKPKAEKK